MAKASARELIGTSNEECPYNEGEIEYQPPDHFSSSNYRSRSNNHKDIGYYQRGM